MPLFCSNVFFIPKLFFNHFDLLLLDLSHSSICILSSVAANEQNHCYRQGLHLIQKIIFNKMPLCIYWRGKWQRGKWELSQKHLDKRRKKVNKCWPGFSISVVSGCLLNGSVSEFSKCRVMTGRSMIFPLVGRITGSCMRVIINGSVTKQGHK